MKKLLIILILLLTLSGCDYKEINDLAILTGIVIDYKDNMYEITAQLVVNDKESETLVFKTKSTSINESIAELSKLSNKEIFISHLKILIITENIIKNNINFKDFFLRSSKSKMNFYIYLIDSKDSDKVLSIYENLDSSAIYIEKMMKFNQNIFSSSTPLSFTDYAYYTYEKGYNQIYPKLSIIKNNNKENLYLANLSTFVNNNEIKLTENESIFYNILTNKANKSSLTIKCNNNDFSIEIQNIKTKYKWKNNTFYISTKSNSKLVDYKCSYDLNDNSSIKKLNKLTSNYIKENIDNVLKNIINNNNDYIGIGNYIYKHNPNYFKYNSWDNYLDKLNIIVNTNIDITSIGEIKNEKR